MHDIDPTRDRHTGTPAVPGVPVVPATPGVDPTIGPVTPVGPVTVEPTTRHFSPFPYIAGLLLLVLGMWGLMSFTGSDRDHDRTEEVAYVQQDLEVDSAPAAEGLRLDATSDRVAEDRVRDNLNQLRRDEMAASTNAARLGDSTASDSTGAILAEQYKAEVASVDLAETTDTSSTADTAPSPGAAASSDQQDAPQIAVVDLDYSQRDIPAMSEQALANEMTQLKADIDRSETTAAKVAQASGIEVLEERLGALEDRVDTTPMPMSEDARLTLTRQLKELRDELASFRKELEALVSAR